MRLKPIIPSVFNFDPQLIKGELGKMLVASEVTMVHFDNLVDLDNFKELLEKHHSIADIHITGNNPIEELSRVIKMNVSFPLRVLMHIESEADIQDFISLAKNNKISPGLAIKLKTPVPDIQKYQDFDYFSLICNDENLEIKTFQDEVFEKIENLHNQLKDKKNTITLDCGVKEEHILPSLEKGVANLVMGSAIFKSANPLETVMKFNSIANSVSLQ